LGDLIHISVIHEPTLPQGQEKNGLDPPFYPFLCSMLDTAWTGTLYT